MLNQALCRVLMNNGITISGYLQPLNRQKLYIRTLYPQVQHQSTDTWPRSYMQLQSIRINCVVVKIIN